MPPTTVDSVVLHRPERTPAATRTGSHAGSGASGQGCAGWPVGATSRPSKLEAGQRGPEAADPARALGPWRVLTASRSTGAVPWHLGLRRVPLLAGLALVAV